MLSVSTNITKHDTNQRSRITWTSKGIGPNVRKIGALASTFRQTTSIGRRVEINPKRNNVRPRTTPCYWISGTQLRFITSAATKKKIPTDQIQFLLESTWYENANVIDQNGHPLHVDSFPAMQPARLRDIIVAVEKDGTENGEEAAVIQSPLKKRPYTQRHTRQIVKWCTIVMLSLPWKIWLTQTTKLQPRSLPQIQQNIKWIPDELIPSSTITATIDNDKNNNGQIMTLTRNQDGWTWKLTKVCSSFQQTPDYTELVAWISREGLSFAATPHTTLYPWIAPPTTQAIHLKFTLRKQRSKMFRSQLRYNLQPILDKIEQKKENSTWQTAAIQQTPRQLWSRQGLFTYFQNWTMYRIALGLLNLHHDGWPKEQDCPEPTCSCTKETMDHIIWSCDKAHQAWKRWLDHWMGGAVTPSQRTILQDHLAARKAPSTTTAFLAIAQQCTARWTDHHQKAMETLWLIWSTVTPVMLWRLRNRHIFEGIHTSGSETASIVWGAGTYQVMAIASAWKAQAKTRVQGLCLEVCHQIMMAVQTDMEIEPLDAWLIRYYASITIVNQAHGGWLVYNRKNEQSWQIRVACSYWCDPPEQHAILEKLVLERAIAEVLQRAEPSQVLLIVDSINNNISKTAKEGPEKAQDKQNEDLHSTFSAFFAVQWGKPRLSTLAAAKTPASTNQTLTYTFNDTNEPIKNSPIREYLLKTAVQLQ